MRLFVALDLPYELIEQINTLTGGLAGVRWVTEENYHLTLRFIGEVPSHTAEEIDLALTGLRGKRLALGLAGVGCHEKAGRVTALWVGVARNPALEHLQTKIETALHRVGLPPDRRRFLPHITLARLDNTPPSKLAAWVQAHNLFRAGAVEISQFTLFSSRLGKEQSAYTAEADYPLA